MILIAGRGWLLWWRTALYANWLLLSRRSVRPSMASTGTVAVPSSARRQRRYLAIPATSCWARTSTSASTIAILPAHPIRCARALLEDGVVIGAVVTLTTDHRRADSALAHLAAIVESSHDAIIGKTLDGIIVSWNHGAERLYGYAAGEVIGRSIALLVPPGYARDLPRIMERLKRGECIAPYETVRVRKDGQRITVAVSHSPIKDAAGTVTGAATIARDLTVRKEAEEALRRSEQRFRLLLLRAYQMLEQRVAERTGALAALYDVTAVASASRDLTTILDHALDRIVAVLESKAATIHLLEDTPAVLQLAAARGLTAAVLAQGDPVQRAPQLGRALLRRRHPLVVRDMAADRRTVRASNVYPSHTYAGVPIRAKGQALGVLSII